MLSLPHVSCHSALWFAALFQSLAMKTVLGSQTQSQLLQWPTGKLVDVIDSWSMHRKVWRSESWDAAPQEDKQYVEDFETILDEVKGRSKNSSKGLVEMNAPNVGQGLTPDGNIYFN